MYMAYDITGPTLLLCMISCINSESLGISWKRAKALIMASIQDSFFFEVGTCTQVPIIAKAAVRPSLGRFP